MKKCSACGNVSKDEVMQCPYCGNSNFIPEGYQANPQMGQSMSQPMAQQSMGQPVQNMGQQPTPSYGGTMNQQSIPGYGSVNQQPASQQPMGQPMAQQPMGQSMPGYGGPMGQQPMPGPMMPQVSQEKGNILWGVVGFLIPIVGWILYFVWKNTKPGDAKMAGIGGIIGFCFNFLITILA